MDTTRIVIVNSAAAAGLATALREIFGSARAFAFEVAPARSPVRVGAGSGENFADVFQSAAPHLWLGCLTPAELPSAAPLVAAAARAWRQVPAIVVTELAPPEQLAELLEAGADDFILAPLRAAEVLPRLARWREPGQSQSTEVIEIKQRLGLQKFIGESPAFVREIRKIPKLAHCDASVLITGETGTGKEMIARALHYLSRRAPRPFVPLNCGSIPSDLLENELFGHEAGAFTSAGAAVPGLVAAAEGGTLFLDEVDSLTPAAQVKLLRLLQEKEFRPLGSTRTHHADVRVVAASNADFEALVRTGRFRRDLYYRLNVLPLHVPPLRERPADIPLLVRHILARAAQELGQPFKELSPTAWHRLAAHSWPGNVRELENVLHRALLLADGPRIETRDIDLLGADGSHGGNGSASFRALKAQHVEQFERNYLQTLLAAHDGNITHAATAAQKNRRAFFELLRKHHLVGDRLPPAASEGRV